MNWNWGNQYAENSFLIDLNRTFVWLENDMFIRNVTQIGKIPLEFEGYFVLINGTQWENVTKGWFEWDNKKAQNYLHFTNGTIVFLDYDYEYLHTYYFMRGGKRFYVDWPMEYYFGNFNGNTIIVPGWFKNTGYYTVANGEKAGMPYQGAAQENHWISWSDLGRTEGEGGIVPEDNYASINGSLFSIKYYEDLEQQGYVIVEDKIINVTQNRKLQTNILGKDVWNITKIGFTMFIANLTNQGTYDLDKITALYLKDELHHQPNETIKLFLLNGTSITAQNRIRVMFYELKVNGTIHFVINQKPRINHEDGTFAFYLLNGSKFIIPRTQDFEIVKVILKDLGLNGWSEPENFTWQDKTYNTTVIIDAGYQIDLLFRYNCVNNNGNRYDIVPLSVIQKTYMSFDAAVPRYPNSYPGSYKEPNSGFCVYKITLQTGENFTLYPKFDYIKTVRPTWGQPFGWHLQEFSWETFAIKKQVHTIIVGAPEWGLWNYRKFKIVPETGALDLDGNLDTTIDQFYVRRVYHGEYDNTQTRNGLNVNLKYDPNPIINENELSVNSWMGISTNTYRNTWNETYYWYYSNMSLVSKETQEMINETIWNTKNTPNPGYWDISRMTLNMTWEDYLKKAEKEGWNWVQEEAKWTWLWFGFEQSYWASNEAENGTFSSNHINLRNEYAGMFLYNDTNDDLAMGQDEATHYFMPQTIDDVHFITPGVAFNDFNDTGMLVVPINEKIEFGVSYLDVNGTMYPFGRSYYAWYEGNVSGTDLQTFNERPVDAELEELSFKLHFYIENSTENNNTEAHIKIDQHVGEWTVDVPSNIAVLENLSLSLNYYVHANIGGRWNIKNENGSVINPNEIVEASKISIDSTEQKFASINMGETYVWGGNLTMPYNVSSFTIPLNTFINTYTDYGSETSICGWTFQSTMYFLSVGFPTWGGRYVYEDPEVVVYLGTSKKTMFDSITDLLGDWTPLIIPPVISPGGLPSLDPNASSMLSAVILTALISLTTVVSMIFLKKRRRV
jgi:hypothetical protein